MRSSELECALLALDEMKAQLDEARRQLKVMTEEHRLACEDRDLMQRERDEARREVSFLRPSVCLGAQTAHDYAKQRGWDCFEITMCKEAQHDLEADTHSG
jgi:uncharacterized protein (DUF3084 family)